MTLKSRLFFVALTVAGASTAVAFAKPAVCIAASVTCETTNSVSKNDSSSNQSEPVSTAYQHRYLDFTQDRLTEALAQNKRVVMFFQASWCSSCARSDANLKAHFNELPEDVIILRADFDNDKALVKKYNVVIQDTLVALNQDGSSLTQWVSSGQPSEEILFALR